MLFKRIIFFLWLSVSFFACSPEVDKSAMIQFYPWANYLNAQIDSLIKHPSVVQKTILLDGKKEQKQVKAIDWKQEWSMFLRADLNTPAAASSYDNLSEDGLIYYLLKSGEDLPVKKLIIHLDGLERPAKVEILIEEKNFLFESQKKLHMNFSGGKVQTYSIDGVQQMRWMSPTKFQLMGILLTK